MEERRDEAIAAVRAQVAALHSELVRYGLVVWTGGNVSGRVPGTDYFVIKPSGVAYDDLAATKRKVMKREENRLVRKLSKQFNLRHVAA